MSEIIWQRGWAFYMSDAEYDVIVVGGGHAGCEAAFAAAQRGCKTLFLTTSLDTIGYLSCGGTIGKNSPLALVEEIDTLGGLLKRIAADCIIHKSFLREKKPFYLLDKREFRLRTKHALECQENLSICQTIVTGLNVKNGRVCGVRTQFKQGFKGECVVLSVGTFLRAKASIGENFISAGRYGEIALEELAENLENNGFLLNRNKIFIGPRLRKDSFDLNLLEVKKNDENTPPLSPVEQEKKMVALDIYLTHDDSGNCLYLEPEGKMTLEIYLEDSPIIVNEIEQKKHLRTLSGLNKAEITRFGYLVEYDYIIPDQLESTLETKTIEGLFTAGQINGTSGHEEAAAQGIVAGINAALRVKGESPRILDRSASSIGALVYNLVNKNLTNKGL
ncbi:MAG: FAD-dependent oxidoreductase [Candidatus Subteraquimicrobiales bacterium]|nr:FAD-dependent oxidoreductase [Candidatus Subteraquimicrobiales bacterium]